MMFVEFRAQSMVELVAEVWIEMLLLLLVLLVQTFLALLVLTKK